MCNLKLAINGGNKAVTKEPGDMFTWPIITKEDEDAVLDVLRRGAMSSTEITREFEKEFALWQGSKKALAYPNGTEALRAAMWACGVGAGDEIICPSMTYWASCTQALGLGAAVNFADISPDTLCLEPSDIEHRIGLRTKAIVVVHYAGYPCEMDEIMAIATKHKLKVIEDVSHAHGGLYKGKKLGTIGDIAGMSMMAGKSFAIGEGGMLVTDNELLYERCIAYGHYERTAVNRWNQELINFRQEELGKYAGVPIGGYKHRMSQMSSAVGRVQLKYYEERIKEIQTAMNRFWDLLAGVPGIRAHRPAKDTGSTMAGWYCARGLYRSDELGGLPCAKFCEAVQAEGLTCVPGANSALHLHPVFHEADLFNQGKPTMLAFGQRDLRQGPGSLPVAESIAEIAFFVPWFKHDRLEIIEEYANAYRKVAENAQQIKF